MSKELEYKDFTSTQKKGIRKFANLSSSDMKKYFRLYRRKTGKNPTNIDNKGSFYSFVARNSKAKLKKVS